MALTMIIRDIRGWQFVAGIIEPHFKLQITPLYWGLALSYGHYFGAFQLGPLAIALWLDPRSSGWESHWGWFDDRPKQKGTDQ